MKAFRIGAAVVAIAASLALAGGASATEPQDVTITVVTHIGSFEDSFEASGGPICAAGIVSNIDGRFVGWQGGFQAQIIQTKRFDCPDGTFDALLRITLDFTSGDTFATWSVVDGTGAYAALHGAGSLTGDKTDPGAGSILDVYTGRMHID